MPISQSRALVLLETLALERIHKDACLNAQNSRSRDDDRYCLARVIDETRAALAAAKKSVINTWPELLRAAPDAALTSEYKRRIAAKRKTFGAGYNGGRPKNPDRCPCGKMTAERAKKRGHKC